MAGSFQFNRSVKVSSGKTSIVKESSMKISSVEVNTYNPARRESVAQGLDMPTRMAYEGANGEES